MTVFDLYFAFENWEPDTTFILMEYAKEIWKGNWFAIPTSYYNREIDEFGLLNNGIIWIELELE